MYARGELSPKWPPTPVLICFIRGTGTRSFSSTYCECRTEALNLNFQLCAILFPVPYVSVCECLNLSFASQTIAFRIWENVEMYISSAS